MSQGILVTIFFTIIAFLVALFLLKSLIKAIIISFVIILLFRIGWVYDSNDLKEKLHVDNFIKSEYIEDVYNKYDDYTNKREVDEIIDTKKIDDTISKELDEKVEDYIKKNRDN